MKKLNLQLRRSSRPSKYGTVSLVLTVAVCLCYHGCGQHSCALLHGTLAAVTGRKHYISRAIAACVFADVEIDPSPCQHGGHGLVTPANTNSATHGPSGRA
jgi:hypothetical protein